MNVVRTLELCAGVGMLSEGIHAGLRHLGLAPRAVGYVERDAYAAAVLLARMEAQALEPAPVWAGNLEAVRWERWAGAVDCIAAGFPCQPHSMAGSRKGTDDDRWIWPAIADCIRMVRPWLVVLENVSGLRSSGGMAPVLADLAALGFRVEWDSVRASDVGASHQRERVFILAYSPEHRRDAAECASAVDDAVRPEWRSSRVGRDCCGKRHDGHGEEDGPAGVSGAACMAYAGHDHQQLQQRPQGSEYPREGGELAYSERRRHERRGVPGIVAGEGGYAEGEARQWERSGDAAHGSGIVMADPSQQGCEGRELRDARHPDWWRPEAHGPATELRGLFAPGPSDPGWADIVREWPELAPATAQSELRGMADGLADWLDRTRSDRLRCVGNGVVALQAGCAVVTLGRRLGVG